jgi:hypothetical protein
LKKNYRNPAANPNFLPNNSGKRRKKKNHRGHRDHRGYTPSKRTRKRVIISRRHGERLSNNFFDANQAEGPTKAGNFEQKVRVFRMVCG